LPAGRVAAGCFTPASGTAKQPLSDVRTGCHNMCQFLSAPNKIARMIEAGSRLGNSPSLPKRTATLLKRQFGHSFDNNSACPKGFFYANRFATS
jgi:hypothetical protein